MDRRDGTPAELQARLQAERRGLPFLLHRDGAGAQVIVGDDHAGHAATGRA